MKISMCLLIKKKKKITPYSHCLTITRLSNIASNIIIYTSLKMLQPLKYSNANKRVTNEFVKKLHRKILTFPS